MSHDSKNPLDKRTEINRRKLLTGVSSLTVGLTSSIWKPSTAFGADAKVPAEKHFIAFFTGNGTIPEHFFPASTGNEVNPLTSTTILKPLEALFGKINVMKGVNHNSMKQNVLGVEVPRAGIEHRQGPAVFLSGGYLTPPDPNGSIGGDVGMCTDPTLDQLIIKSKGGTTYQYGVQSNRGEPYLGSISYAPISQPIGGVKTIRLNPNDDPLIAYARLGDQNSAQTSAAELQRRLNERKSMLDYINAELKSLKTKMSAEDKIRLDSHLAGIRDIELNLATTSQCSTAASKPSYDERNLGSMIKTQIDLMILAHKCGIQKVSTFTLGHANSFVVYDFLGFTTKYKGYHHEMSHGYDPGLTPGSFTEQQKDEIRANFAENLLKINVYHSERFMYLLQALNAIPTADGNTLLDNSAVLWGSDIGHGGHTYNNIPYILAGSAGGAFKTGRFLDYTTKNSIGLPHNNLLLSIAQGMGLSNTSIGLPGVCTGPLRNLA